MVKMHVNKNFTKNNANGGAIYSNYLLISNSSIFVGNNALNGGEIYSFK